MASKGVDGRDTCSVCLEPYRGRQPKLLPCSHTFCLPCLKEIATKEGHQSNKGQGKLTCPTCRTSTPLPPGGVASLQDITVHGSGKTGNGDPRPLLCDLCEEGQEAEAKLTCATCQTCFCTRCRRYHDKLCKTGQVTEIKVQRQEEKVEDMDVKGLASALSQLMKKHTEMQELFGALQERNAVLEKRCQIMERELASLRDKSAIVNQDNQNLRDDVVNVKNDLAQGQAHLSSMQDVVNAVQTQQDKVQGDVNTLIADHGMMKASQTGIQRRVDTLTTEQGTLKGNQKVLESKVESVIQDQKKLATPMMDQAAVKASQTAMGSKVESLIQGQKKLDMLMADHGTMKASQAAMEFQMQSLIHDQKMLSILTTDQRRLKENQKRVESKVESLTQGQKNLARQVAFQAERNDECTEQTLNAGSRVVCSGVVFSVGGGYNPGTGVFTAPVSGLYCFIVSASVGNVDPRAYCSIDIVVKDKRMDAFVAYCGGQATGHSCVQMKAGERIWLNTNEQSNDPAISFSGFLVQPES